MTVSSVTPTGIPAVDQSIAAAQTAIAASQSAYPTGGTISGTNNIVTPSATDLAQQAAVNAATQLATSHGSIGFAPASYATSFAKLSVDQMLISSFMSANGLSGSGSPSQLQYTPDPIRGGFDLFL